MYLCVSNYHVPNSSERLNHIFCEMANPFWSELQPERINGSQNGYNYKSDIWSLGLILLECATGRFPYTPPDQGERWESIFELIETVVDKPPPAAPSDQFSSEFCSFVSAW